MEGSLEQKRREVSQLESQLLSAHRAAQETLEEDRKSLAERERQLAFREKDVEQRDEQRLQAEGELATKRVELEAREGDLAQALQRHDDNVTAQRQTLQRFQLRFAEKKKEAEAALAEREIDFRRTISQEFRDKADRKSVV